ASPQPGAEAAADLFYAHLLSPTATALEVAAIAHFFCGFTFTVEGLTPAPLAFAFSVLPLASSDLAAPESLTLSVTEAPSAIEKEALPITRVLVFLPCLTLALSWMVPLQGPPVQASLSWALPDLTVAVAAALAVPSAGGGGLVSSFFGS